MAHLVGAMSLVPSNLFFVRQLKSVLQLQEPSLLQPCLMLLYGKRQTTLTPPRALDLIVRLPSMRLAR